MTHTDNTIWLAKLAAWTHDPAEKALVLLRDPAGHEGGTVRELRATLFPAGVSKPIAEHVKRADHWASAADRPQFPRSDKDGRYASWTQVRFHEQAVLIHPLSGTEYDLGKLDVEAAHIRAVSTAHFNSLIERDADGQPDARRTALSFWRFGPELDADGLRHLWQLLPADTRIPDHTIWTHLDLSAAFASSFAGDVEANPALLTMSFGPVQDFIAQARTTSDLWAGSHLLSRLAWEGLKVICERLGPDAVLFPQLRGVPQVDLWLREEMKLNRKRFLDCAWASDNNKTDANPLFAAALPNKFVALVPASQARELAEAITEAVRGFVRDTAAGMLAELLDAAKIANTPELYCHTQLARQLEGFPEVHWAAVPFGPLVKTGEGDAPDVSGLVAASQPFFGNTELPGFLGSSAWKVLSKAIEIDGTRFYRPNPGVLYPAIHALLERLAASAKAVREAPQRPGPGEQGYRCDLTGEAEWLTHDSVQLAIPKGARKDAPTLWNLAARALPGISRKSEHLCAQAMLKRRWPSWFVRKELGSVGIDVTRFIVSTHTLAIATSIERWLNAGAGFGSTGEDLLQEAEALGESAALPRKLMRQLWQHTPKTRQLARALPALLEDKDLSDDVEAQSETSRKVASLLGDKPETYYAMILLDGDRMGAWISGDEAIGVLTRDTFHPQIRVRMTEHFTGPGHHAYLDARRAVSPSRHMAISGALNGFSLQLAQEIVENRCKGKLIYAGGDDVMALVAVDDLLACLTLLRAAYAGLPLPTQLADAVHADLGKLRIGKGHAELDGRLIRLMGETATASAGAVIAHHQAPLGAVLRELRKAEKRAKGKGGRDAFAITLLKRSGGATELVLPWRMDETSLENSPMQILAELQNLFAGDTSRKAAYLTQGWLPSLPTQMPDADLEALLAASLGYQLKRQGGKDVGDALAGKLAALAVSVKQKDTSPADIVRDVLAVAEFLARESRSKGNPQP